MTNIGELLRNKAHRINGASSKSAPAKKSPLSASKKAKGGVIKRPPGRPRIKVIPAKPEIEKAIDLELVKKLAFVHCTEAEIAAVFDIPLSTLAAQPAFQETYKRWKGKGKKSLRRWMWANAEKGNIVMQIWLSKNELGYKEPAHEITGKDGAPIKTDLNINVISPLAKDLTEKIVGGARTEPKEEVKAKP